jgi:hypothetical protein
MSQNVICYRPNKIKANLATEKEKFLAIYQYGRHQLMAKNENYVTFAICVIN